MDGDPTYNIGVKNENALFLAVDSEGVIFNLDDQFIDILETFLNCVL